MYKVSIHSIDEKPGKIKSRDGVRWAAPRKSWLKDVRLYSPPGMHLGNPRKLRIPVNFVA